MVKSYETESDFRLIIHVIALFLSTNTSTYIYVTSSLGPPLANALHGLTSLDIFFNFILYLCHSHATITLAFITYI